MSKEKDFLHTVADQFGDDIDIGKDDNIKTWVDTGNYALNRIISGDYLRGYPCGKIVELFGDPACGKSFFIYKAIANFQKQFGKDAACILDDTEDAFMTDVGNKLGVDSDRLLRLSSETVEEHFNKMFLGTEVKKGDDEDEGGRKKKQPGMLPFILGENPDAKILLALDSVAALSTVHEKDKGFEKDDMTKAKKLKAGLRMNWPFISNNDVLYMIANHVYDVITAYIPTKATPGGKGIPFMSSVRIEMTMKQKHKNAAGVITGVDSDLFIRKNKVAPPFRRTTIKIDFMTGIAQMDGVADLLVEDGILHKKSGGWLYLDKEKKIRESELTEELFLSLLSARGKKEPIA
jgi:RecA/RadA recombinase